MPESITSLAAEQTPGFVIVPEVSFTAFPFPGNVFVCDGNVYSHPTPFHLPVAAACQALSAQHLAPVIKALRVVGTGLLLALNGHFSVPIGQTKVLVGC